MAKPKTKPTFEDEEVERDEPNATERNVASGADKFVHVQNQGRPSPGLPCDTSETGAIKDLAVARGWRPTGEPTAKVEDHPTDEWVQVVTWTVPVVPNVKDDERPLR